MRYLICLTLLASFATAQEAADESMVAWQALQKEYQDASNEFLKPWREAKAKGEDLNLDYSKHPRNTFAARYEEFAREHAGTEGGLQALGQLLRLGRTNEVKQWALGTLLEDHVKSKALTSVMFGIRYAHWADRESALRTIAEKSPHKDVRGRAFLALGQVLKKDPPKALRIFARVQEEYGDVVYSGRRTLGDQAGSEIFEMKNLSVGKVAPEIEGEDIDGVPLKLSDYRGKVILIDFWGDW